MASPKASLSRNKPSRTARRRSFSPITATAPASATWLLKEIIAQDLSHVLVATIADAAVTAKLKAQGAKLGEAFDMEVGGLVDESAGHTRAHPGHDPDCGGRPRPVLGRHRIRPRQCVDPQHLSGADHGAVLVARSRTRHRRLQGHGDQVAPAL